MLYEIMDICCYFASILGTSRICVFLLFLLFFFKFSVPFPPLVFNIAFKNSLGSLQNWMEIEVFMSIFKYSVLFIIFSLWHFHNVELWDIVCNFRFCFFFVFQLDHWCWTVFKDTGSFCWVQFSDISDETFEGRLSDIKGFLFICCLLFLLLPLIVYIFSAEILHLFMNIVYSPLSLLSSKQLFKVSVWLSSIGGIPSGSVDYFTPL